MSVVTDHGTIWGETTMVAQTLGAGATGYDATARALHWVTAAIVLFLLAAGIYMTNGPEGPLADTLYELHRSFGLVLIPVVVARVFWRATHPAPPLPADIPLPQRAVAHLVHGALYGLLVIQPLIGWVGVSSYRAPMKLFWVVPVPPIWPENRAFSEWLFTVHGAIGIALLVLIALHVGGALFHHFVRRDNVLMRMVRG
ncbi:cytochrome b [Xanthobacteraceae bacterium Astr-EGSB]|uniref:cytochrome b n=1 Tax=Astrobacterium formosum TaxID=3069710 RepID=UPI0027B85348|nr:cytochrome b [Xanthobacteraceae bacterium Astr-EGSB]